MARGAASADIIVDKYAVLLLDIREISDSPSLVARTHIIWTRGIYMQGWLLHRHDFNVVSHRQLAG